MGGSTNGNFGRTLGRKNQYREKINSLPKNPKATGKGDYYLDKYGNPVPKNSKNSHIIP